MAEKKLEAEVRVLACFLFVSSLLQVLSCVEANSKWFFGCLLNQTELGSASFPQETDLVVVEI